jgi:hypothetical protein
LAESDKAEVSADPFDRLYRRWAEYALDKNLEPPSREKWDYLVLRLLLARDPERQQRYRSIEKRGDGGLGSDAYELWGKMPSYTPNRSVPVKSASELKQYEQTTRGSMRALMEKEGLLDRYNALVEQAEKEAAIEKTRIRSAQTRILTIGCVGISILVFMVLTVLLIIALKMLT